MRDRTGRSSFFFHECSSAQVIKVSEVGSRMPQGSAFINVSHSVVEVLDHADEDGKESRQTFLEVASR